MEDLPFFIANLEASNSQKLSIKFPETKAIVHVRFGRQKEDLTIFPYDHQLPSIYAPKIIQLPRIKFLSWKLLPPLLFLPLWAMSDLVSEAWKRYLLQLQLRPLRTKAITAGVIAGISDFAAQKISGIKKLQFRRLFLIMLYGLLYSGPFGHFFHKLMDKFFKGKKGRNTVGRKVLVEQLTAGPCNNIIFMMYYGLVVDGRKWSFVKGKVWNDYPSVQLTAWKFWPMVSWVNYQYVPLQLRVLFPSFFACCWAIFLNLKARSTAIKKA